MVDIDKVIKAWEIFRDSNPYQICEGIEFRAISEPEYCMSQMIADTLELLKEYEVLKEQNAKLIRQKEARFQQKWIPVEEELPVPCQMVIVSYPAYTDESGDEYVAGVGCGFLITTATDKYWCRSDGTKFGELGFSKVEPVAWMPLPNPFDG